MISVRYVRNIFLRGICIIYLFSFLSFYIQIPGLYGDNGILPAKNIVDLKSSGTLLQKIKQKPTLLWLAPYLGLNIEYMLDVVTLLGISFSFMGFVSQKFCISLVYVGLWAFYYSINQIGQTFMRFQWDALLLEAGFLSIIVAPIKSTNFKRSTPSDSLTFLAVRWLLFRLMFGSGVVKLLSGCPVWWGLDALNVHFESQCIPTPLAWYAHHLPKWLLRLGTVGSNIIELVVPFLFFFPNRKVRLISFFLQVYLQIHIIATGNYNFFNLLTILLCVSLLDDQFFYSSREKSKIQNRLSTTLCVTIYGIILYGTYIFYKLKFNNNWSLSSKIGFTQKQFENVIDYAVPFSIVMGSISLTFSAIYALAYSLSNIKNKKKKGLTTLATLFYAIIVAFYFTVTIVPFTTSLQTSKNLTIPIEVKKLYSKVEHLSIANSYGLFARMTGADGRPEVIIEGSNSIEGPWKEYNFLYKPGNINSSLPFVAPHQPRLDWQMWFAALGTYHNNPWLMSLAYRLLHGQPEVLALINNKNCAFCDKPPKYIKASLYRYHYTPWTQRNSPSWWSREKVEEYFPIFSKDHPPLIEYLHAKRILQNKSTLEVKNTTLKLLLDFIRSLIKRVEATVLLWSVFAAGLAITLTR